MISRRKFLKWFGVSTVVVATTNPVKLLEGLVEPKPIKPEFAVAELQLQGISPVSPQDVREALERDMRAHSIWTGEGITEWTREDTDGQS